MKAWIAGSIGPRLTRDERSFFADELPFGFILFRRNIVEASQLYDLVAGMKDAVGREDVPVFVDQEGGRIQRLRPPLAPDYPSAGDIGALFRRNEERGLRAAWLHAHLLADDLAAYGINANCVPCLDVPAPGSHSIIGDRAYSEEPEIVALLGRAAADGTLAAGALPVMKHMPGHGRGDADSHLSLPVVDIERDDLELVDFLPFRALNDLPAAMTAHLLFSRIDPVAPATLSPKIIEEIIRGSIGFDGLLMTDDISMKALSGDFGDLSKRAIDAGCDVVLHCNGDMAEMRPIADAVPELGGAAARRAQAAVKVLRPADERRDVEELREEFEDLVAVAA